MSTDSFEISHSWSQPPDAQYRNGYKVSYADYRESGVHIVFTIYPKESTNRETMVLEVPANIRILFANDWRHCKIVIQRVIDYLTTIDESTSGIKYNKIVVDTSKVSGWLTTQMALFERNHTFLNDSLPSARTVPFVVLGLLIALQIQYYPVNILPRKEEGLLLVLDGMLILSMLLRDIFERSIFFLSTPFPVLRSMNTSRLRFTVLGTFKRYWRRYLTTFSISLLLIVGGVIVGEVQEQALHFILL